jgi:hypothetical protein
MREEAPVHVTHVAVEGFELGDVGLDLRCDPLQPGMPGLDVGLPGHRRLPAHQCGNGLGWVDAHTDISEERVRERCQLRKRREPPATGVLTQPERLVRHQAGMASWTARQSSGRDASIRTDLLMPSRTSSVR